MKLRLSHVPLRLVTGAFILNSGLSHLGMEDEKAASLHGMATGAFPGIKRVDPKPFGQALAVGEVALGVALLVPIVPSGLAGLGLGAFSGALLTMYARTPALHREGSLLPSEQGIGVAKDLWMAGIAAALLVDQAAGRRSARSRRRLQRKVTLTEERLGTERTARSQALEDKRGAQGQLVRVQADLLKAKTGRRVERAARKAAVSTAKQAAKQAAKLGTASTAKVGASLVGKATSAATGATRRTAGARRSVRRTSGRDRAGIRRAAAAAGRAVAVAGRAAS